MHRRFGRSHLALSIARMWDNLKQEDSVEEYIKAHDKIRQLLDNQVQADQGFVCHAFIWILKPGLAKFIRDKDCKTIEDAYQEACNAEQKAKFTTCSYNGNNGQSFSSNYWGNNNNKRKKYSEYNNNRNVQPEDRSKDNSKR